MEEEWKPGSWKLTIDYTNGVTQNRAYSVIILFRGSKQNTM